MDKEMVKSEGYGRDGVGYKKGEGRIRLLPDEVASQVAAGEVVERPASVLKELIENSLDAEARSIDVEFAYGGVGLIFVRDDGVGMNRDDALLSLERHATSKIRCAEDLFRISTYGFRGEALPSIASVSKFRLVTRPRDESLGTAISVEGGKILSVQDSGEAPGTSVEVRSLFFNIPARRKFLRSELTETGHLLHCFQTFALAHPSVGFTLRKDNRILYQLASSGDLTTRVFDLFGEDWKSALLPFLEIQIRSIRIRGMFSALPPRYYGRSYQYFFLNNRPITDPAILRGIRSALPVSENDNRLPACILFLEMSPEKFDCNVHPAKREVRFRSPDEVEAAVEEFVRESLNQTKLSFVLGSAGISAPTAAEKIATIGSPLTGEQKEEKDRVIEPSADSNILDKPVILIGTGDFEHQPKLQLDTISRDEQDSVEKEKKENGKVKVPEFRFLSMLGDRYFLWQSEEGLVLMDVRNAYERIYYDRFCLLNKKDQKIHLPSQYLLPPVNMNFTPREIAWIVENSELFAELGLRIEQFGPTNIKIEAVPAGLDDLSPEEILNNLCTRAKSAGKAGARRFIRDELMLALARMHASRSKISAADAPNLLETLFACELPYVSPSGKPILLLQSWRELDRKFA